MNTTSGSVTLSSEKVAAIATAMKTYDAVSSGPKTWRELAYVALNAAEQFDELQRGILVRLDAGQEQKVLLAETLL
jgi:hypothetical protein